MTGPRIDMTGWVMAEHGVPDSLIIVIGLDEEFEKYRVEHHLKKTSKWLCKCMCGSDKIFSVLGSDLKRKDGKGTRSCGCLHQKVMDNFWRETFVDLTGQQFGLLKVLRKAEKNEILNERGGNHAHWICQCQCGNIKTVCSQDLISGDTKSCGCATDSIGNLIVKNYLDLHNIKYEKEYSFSDLVNTFPLRFDFKVNIDDSKYFLIEVQGLQHYQPIELFGGEKSFLKQQYNDNLKRDYCKTKNIKLYEIKNWNTTSKKIEQELVEILKKEGALTSDQIVV